MKTQKISKKLTLHKQTLVNLDNGDLNRARGGVDTRVTLCPTIISYSCKCGVPVQTCDAEC
jgi:hypothetical protein